jgi:POT family proton-dependent oligopeptide transporter
MMMGVWLSTSFLGGFGAGYLGTFWSSMTKPAFFLMLAIVSVIAAAVIALLIQPLRRMLRE